MGGCLYAGVCGALEQGVGVRVTVTLVKKRESAVCVKFCGVRAHA